MNEFFRIHARPDHHAMTLRMLAAAVHKAEDTDDDVSLIECMDEIQRREGMFPGATNVFMEHEKMKPVYKSSDDREYASIKEATARDKIVAQAARIKAAVAGLQCLLKESAVTADGQPFDAGRSKTYWRLMLPYGSMPRIREIWVWPHNISVDLERGNNGSVVVREYCDGSYHEYPVCELYAEETKAGAALVSAADEWLADKTREVEELKRKMS